ncbi:MAG: helix-turn-helix domain-containing protein [Ruminococcus flavefaciens]|nr:helix-turn-helix domain-containing protein [Ruminococcus flavefaciens]MCM1008974.1 helix-turn-helix domain-containing protein [Ruminococcus flavefaciens]
MTLGNKIRNRREELGFTQVELAKKARLTQATISRIEDDIIAPKATTLIVLAISLDLAPNAFLTEERRAS